MAINLDQYKAELDQLIALGENLQNSMNYQTAPEQFRQAAAR